MTKSIASLQRTKELLKRHGLHLKKSLGQNFLIDEMILHRIVSTLDLTVENGAIEIGPGIGALTEELAQKAGKVVSVEIDGRLVSVLRQIFEPNNNVKVIHADFLKLDLDELKAEFGPDQKLTVAANLPYYITTPILLKLLHSDLNLRTIVVMVQKEVADRIAAKPGDKSYGSLSIAVQYYARAATVLEVPRTAFLPNPNVDSAVLRLEMLSEPPVRVSDEDFFFQVIRASFRQRRKTIFNNLTHNLFPKIEKEELRGKLEASGIDPARRAETLSIEEFARLAEAVSTLG